MWTCSVSSSIASCPPTTTGRVARRQRTVRADVRKRRRDELQRLVVIDRSSEADHHRTGVVVRLEEAPDVVRADRLHRLTISSGLSAQRMVGEQLRGEGPVGDIVGRVVVHGQLFEDHQTFAVDIGLAQRRPDQHIAEQVDTEHGMTSRQPEVVRRVLLGGERVEVAADSIHRPGDLLRRPRRCALEQQVLQEVADATQLRRLVSRPHAHPDTGGHRQRARHVFGGHGEAGFELTDPKVGHRPPRSVIGARCRINDADAGHGCGCRRDAGRDHRGRVHRHRLRHRDRGRRARRPVRHRRRHRS